MYQLTEKGKKHKRYLIQEIPDCGTYDYTDCMSYEDAVEEIIGDIKAGGSEDSYNDMKDDAEESINEYDQEEIFEQIKFGWPEEFGYVEEVEE